MVALEDQEAGAPDDKSTAKATLQSENTVQRLVPADGTGTTVGMNSASGSRASNSRNDLP